MQRGQSGVTQIVHNSTKKSHVCVSIMQPRGAVPSASTRGHLISEAKHCWGGAVPSHPTYSAANCIIPINSQEALPHPVQLPPCTMWGAVPLRLQPRYPPTLGGTFPTGCPCFLYPPIAAVPPPRAQP
ncbi:hypothetical protein KIL84_003768 [Mauremys mutica]|uniref:Uncharacterized protein n=1 Tax=Mauremys mutica TaxID=74926 RepID=A0A9D4ATT7_9SAUR|nr:hypothetical protein KIL84_003768 [Mauremys mutica]